MVRKLASSKKKKQLKKKTKSSRKNYLGGANCGNVTISLWGSLDCENDNMVHIMITSPEDNGRGLYNVIGFRGLNDITNVSIPELQPLDNHLQELKKKQSTLEEHLTKLKAVEEKLKALETPSLEELLANQPDLKLAVKQLFNQEHYKKTIQLNQLNEQLKAKYQEWIVPIQEKLTAISQTESKKKYIEIKKRIIILICTYGIAKFCRQDDTELDDDKKLNHRMFQTYIFKGLKTFEFTEVDPCQQQQQPTLDIQNQSNIENQKNISQLLEATGLLTTISKKYLEMVTEGTTPKIKISILNTLQCELTSNELRVSGAQVPDLEEPVYRSFENANRVDLLKLCLKTSTSTDTDPNCYDSSGKLIKSKEICPEDGLPILGKVVLTPSKC